MTFSNKKRPHGAIHVSVVIVLALVVAVVTVAFLSSRNGAQRPGPTERLSVDDPDTSVQSGRSSPDAPADARASNGLYART